MESIPNALVELKTPLIGTIAKQMKGGAQRFPYPWRKSKNKKAVSRH
jgi:hypothetical protein